MSRFVDAWKQPINIGDIAIRLSRQKYVVGKPEIITNITAKMVSLNNTSVDPSYILVVKDFPVENTALLSEIESLKEKYSEDIEKNKQKILETHKVKKKPPVYNIFYKINPTTKNYHVYIAAADGDTRDFSFVKTISNLPEFSKKYLSKNFLYKTTSRYSTHKDFRVTCYLSPAHGNSNLSGKSARNFLDLLPEVGEQMEIIFTDLSEVEAFFKKDVLTNM